MTAKTIPKLKEVIQEFESIFHREGHEWNKSKIIPKNMDFNDPSSVEKDFQNVRFD